MMENKLIESLLYHDAALLATLLTDRFNEHVQLTHLNPLYMVHFFMGLSSIMMSSDMRSKYGIQRVIFTNFKDEQVLRLIILTDKRSPSDTRITKSMKVRTFDMGEKRTSKRMILSVEENKVMKFLLNGEIGDLPKDFIGKVLPRTEPNSGKFNLDEYIVDYAKYAVYQEQIHKIHHLDTQTRDASQLFIPSDISEPDFVNFKNQIILFTDKNIISLKSRENFNPDAILSFYNDYYSTSDGAGLKKFGQLFTGSDGLAETFNKISDVRGIASECGFTHGLLFLLSHSYPSYIEVRQTIPTAYYTPHLKPTVDPSTEMLLIYKPQFTGSGNSIHQVPIVCFFPKHYSNEEQAVFEVPLSMSIRGEVGGMSVQLWSNQISSLLSKVQKRPDLVDLLLSLVSTDYDEPEGIAYQIQYALGKIRPSFREYKFSDRRYISRYLAGWIMSSENENSEVFALLSKKLDNGNTKFLIKSANADEKYYNDMTRGEYEDDSDISDIMLVIAENEMPDLHHLGGTYPERHESRRFEDQDILVLNIRQEYVHSKRDFLVTDNEQDFTRFTVTASYANSEDVLNSHTLLPLPRTPLSKFDSLSKTTTELEKKQIIELLEAGSYFAADGKDYEAFLDGIFLTNKCLKSTSGERTVHSDLYYIRPAQGRRGTIKMNFKKVYDELTDEGLVEIAKSANQEALSFSKNGKSKPFQFIMSEKADEFKVMLLNKDQMAKCANARLRRSLTCGVNFAATDKQPEVITPKVYKSLSKISKISNYMMLGFMVRDAVSDAVHKHYGALAADIAFLLASTFSPAMSQMVTNAGSALLKTGSKFSGYMMKSLGFGIRRAISIYVFADFIKNAIAYSQDTNNTDAKLGMAIDGAFVAMDLLTIAAEAIGAGAVLGPIGEIGGALLILGLNVYQTTKRVQQIENIIPLHSGEVIDENLRAFFHMDINGYAQELINEKELNMKLMREAVDYLNSQNQIDTYISASADSSSGTLTIHGDTIIDMRSSFYQRVSRTSPGIDTLEMPHQMHMACFVHEEKIEIEHEPSFWEKFTGFFSNIYKKIRAVDKLVEGNDADALDAVFKCDDCIKKNTPTCHNAFGISKTTSPDKAALFKLGSKSDFVHGYIDKANIFLLASGVKNISGGSKSDSFLIGAGLITGVLDGISGADILDLSSFSPDELNIQHGGIIKYSLGSNNGCLQIHNIETIIMPTTKNYIKLDVGCGFQKIVAQNDINLLIKSNYAVTKDLVLELAGNTNIINHGQSEKIIYIIKLKGNVSLSIFSDTDTKHLIFITENLFDIQSQVHQNGTLIFQMTNGRMFRLSTSWRTLNNTEITFKDGSIVKSTAKMIIQASLSTASTVPEIETLYSNVVERLGILMVAYSSTDDESITISHGEVGSKSSLILSNAIDHSTHMMLNGGRYLIIIHPDSHGHIENITNTAKFISQ